MIYVKSPAERFIDFINPLLVRLKITPKLFSCAYVSGYFFEGYRNSTLCIYLPPNSTCQITHSTNPHKWDNRWVPIGTVSMSMSTIPRSKIKYVSTTPEQLLTNYPEYLL